MKKIFISHRSLDSAIVDELLQYLENIGINRDTIMYTSADSTGAQYHLGSEVRESLVEAEKIIVILSSNYYASEYCNNELGYIWAAKKIPIIFALDEISSEKDYRGFTDENWKLRRVNNPHHIDFLFQELLGFSKKTFTSPVKPNEYKEAYIKKVNVFLEKSRLNKKTTLTENYQPTKIIDINLIISSNHYTDKELLFFKYIKDKNQYIWGITEDIKTDIAKWEKTLRLKPFLSENLESFLIMLVKKGYLNNEIITRDDWKTKKHVGKTDDYSKTVLAIFGADEKGQIKHNYFSMDERLFRVIATMDSASIQIIAKVVSKYKLKWWQKVKVKNDKR